MFLYSFDITVTAIAAVAESAIITTTKKGIKWIREASFSISKKTEEKKKQ